MKFIISKLKVVYWFFEKRVANVFYSYPFLFIIFALLLIFFKPWFSFFLVAFLAVILFCFPNINFFKQLLKKMPSPFSVVLMMTTLALPVLSLIAMPNIHEIQPRGIQSEAKIQLAALYLTQVDSKAEYGTYATCIKDIGYEPSPRGRYIIGFHFPNSLVNKDIINKGKKCNEKSFVVPNNFLNSEFNKLPLSNSNSTKIDKNSFTAAAIGYIGIGPGYKLDIWTIDQNKKLIHLQDGNQKNSLEPQPFYSDIYYFLLDKWNSIRH